MSDSLRSLSDYQILTRTQTLAVQERALTLNLLLHLNEIERRKLHLKQGHTSLFVYCTTGLGYSASAAKRRICTARCVERFPQVLPLLQANEINLSTVTQVSRILRPDNADAILNRIRGKSQRQVEAIVAEYEPLAVLPRERVRTVVVRVPVTALPEPIPDAPAESHVDDQEMTPGAAVPGDQVRNGPNKAPQPVMMFERRSVVQFSAREEVMTKLEHVRALASHRLAANASLEQLIEFLADYFNEREDPKARHDRRESRQSMRKQLQVKSTDPRHIPAKIRDEVFVRDQQQCTYVGLNGRRCGAAHVLQLDHIKPVARGGASTSDNLRLLCAHHNRLEAERLMGTGPPHAQ